MRQSSSDVVIRRSKGMCNPERRSQLGLRRSPRLHPEIGFNQLGLRRSPRRHTNSAMNMSQSTEMAPCKPRKAPQILTKGFDNWSIVYRGTPDRIAKSRRLMRQIEARYFVLSYSRRSTLSDGNHNIKEKRCIVVSDKVRNTYNERSHGITWVAVHGVNSICAVYKNDKSEIERICDFLGQRLRTQYFGMYVLSEMEDLADLSSYSEELGGKPFAVVSVNSFPNVDKESCHKASLTVPDEDVAIGFLQGKLKTDTAIADHETIQASLAVPDEKTAIDFLKGKMKTDSALADHETIQTAIDGFQQLFHQDFKAEEINVFIFKDNTSCDPRRPLMKSEINEHLTSIKQRRSRDISLIHPMAVDDDIPDNQ